MNLDQALEILNENRPNRPRSLEMKKLQQAIDTVKDYTSEDIIESELRHRCEECKNYCAICSKSKTHPYDSTSDMDCQVYNLGFPKNTISCRLFMPKEDNK